MKLAHSIVFIILLSVIITSVNAQNLLKDKPYKFGNFLIVSPDTMKIDYIVKGQPLKKIISAGDTLYEDDKYLILGNADILMSYYVYVIFKKYTAPYNFRMYECPVYKGKLAPPNFKTDTAAWLFRTQIRDQCKKEGINFDGHYTLIKWGCGSECIELAIVDRISGTINYSNINLEGTNPFFTLEYKPNSSLVIKNDWMFKIHIGYIICSDTWNIEMAKWEKSRFISLPK